MTERRKNPNDRRAEESRVVRIENYRKLISAMRVTAMTAEDMAALLGLSVPCARTYQRALARAELSVKMHCKLGRYGNVGAYKAVGSDAKVEKFLAFVRSCLTIGEEVKQKTRVVNHSTGSVPLEHRQAVIVKAAQVGMQRDSLVAALFGPARAVA